MFKIIPHSKPQMSEEDFAEVISQIKSGMHASGEQTRLFEEKVSGFMGAKYAKAVSSGTAALHLSLMALDVEKGDEVIMPSYVCQSLLNAVNYTGAEPVLADICSGFDNEGFNISAETINPLITSKTKAIILPHMFGVPADIKSVHDLGIPVIGDCAQSLGSKLGDIPLGKFGAVSTLSFYATKMISTGQGGMVLTSSPLIKERLDDLTKYDQRDSYKVAYNYCLTDIQSALGLSQLEKLGSFIERRKEIADKYSKAFLQTSLNLPVEADGGVWYRYIIMTDSPSEREALQKKLRNAGIMAERPVFKPIHRYLGLDPKKFPNSEYVHGTALSIPIYPALTDGDVRYVIKNVLDFCP